MRRSYRRTAAGARCGGRARLGARGASRGCAGGLECHDLQGGASTAMRSAGTLQRALGGALPRQGAEARAGRLSRPGSAQAGTVGRRTHTGSTRREAESASTGSQCERGPSAAQEASVRIEPPSAARRARRAPSGSAPPVRSRWGRCGSMARLLTPTLPRICPVRSRRWSAAPAAAPGPAQPLLCPSCAGAASELAADSMPRPSQHSGIHPTCCTAACRCSGWRAPCAPPSHAAPDGNCMPAFWTPGRVGWLSARSVHRSAHAEPLCCAPAEARPAAWAARL